MKPEIAHYMFAYYAIKCWDNDDFWIDIERDSIYWSVFEEFVLGMKALEMDRLTIGANKKLGFSL